MWISELFDVYLSVLAVATVVVAVLVLVSGLDDLVIDVIYWVRRVWRRLAIYSVHEPLRHDALYSQPEKPLAIMVPAWQETGVIGSMAALAATTLDYENYHIFVGTYPNDPDTQRDVDAVCARFRNVHKVVCARPGPTSKADCLNNILDAILQFERRANVQFQGFILHDAEDVVSEMELRLFNYLVARKDLIQLPVYPLERRWMEFTSSHYVDEFAELHAKDLVVREAVTGQVPSAGVGTCFSRQAVMGLLADGDGIAFDVQSLTEDYDIGFRLRLKGMSEIFVRFPVDKENQARRAVGQSAREASVVCVREYFPGSRTAAIRQKSRWIIGIVFQGFRTHRWTSSLPMNYFLWRDRKGAVTSIIGFCAIVLMLQVIGLWMYQALGGGRQLFAVFQGNLLLNVLLPANGLLMLNRLAHRAFFVSRYYGVREGLLSAPRVLWGTYINFMASCRALRQVLAHGDPRRVAWDKTTHEFPIIGEAARARRPLGEILVAQGAISESALGHALFSRPACLRLGSWLVHENRITAAQLADAVAEQCGARSEPVDALALPPEVVAEVPAEVALRYAVLPLRVNRGTLVLASENPLDPVASSAIARRLKRPIEYVIAAKGQVTVGLRYWHGRKQENPRAALRAAMRKRGVPMEREPQLWEEYVSRQLLFTEVLLTLGHLDAAALQAVLLRHDRRSTNLGRFLVDENIVTPAMLEEALALQQQWQPTIDTIADGALGVPSATLAGSAS